MPKKLTKHEEELLNKLSEMTEDLQRTRADFENFRKRVEDEKTSIRDASRVSTIAKLIPIIDDIDRAVAHVPSVLADDAWANGIVTLAKSLDKALESVGIKKINAKTGVVFNPDLHNAVQFDEESIGEKEVVKEELQSGYTIDGHIVRTAMVKVARM